MVLLKEKEKLACNLHKINKTFIFFFRNENSLWFIASEMIKWSKDPHENDFTKLIIVRLQTSTIPPPTKKKKK